MQSSARGFLLIFSSNARRTRPSHPWQLKDPREMRAEAFSASKTTFSGAQSA